MLTSCSTTKRKKNVSVTKPNILFIVVDDLRPELNFYGAKHIHSPNLDKLASKSLIFNRAYCNVPVCGASRASLLTGARPTRSRFLGAHITKDEDYPKGISLPMALKNNGYITISNGKIYHKKEDDTAAWNEIWQPNRRWRYATEKAFKFRKNHGRGMPTENVETADSTYMDGKLALKVVNDLQKLKNTNKPFFLTMGIAKPHLPFNAPKKYWDLYERKNIKLPKNYTQPKSTPKKTFHNFSELRKYKRIPKKGDLQEDLAKELIHGYYACVSYIDAQIGIVLDELERLKLEENTIIVLLGDHGWNLGEHKLWCKQVTFEKALRTPLLLKVPKKTKGEKTDAIVEFIDIYPSLMELIGLEIPKTVDGKSFVPTLNGKKTKKNWAVSKWKDAVTLVKDTLFYTEWVDDNGVAYERMLFDHKTDPLELNNLAEKESYQNLVKRLSLELRAKWGENFLK